MTAAKIPAGSVELSGELVLPPAEDQDHALRFDIDLLTQRACLPPRFGCRRMPL